jgi:uncharacterized protein (DUF488 family)
MAAPPPSRYEPASASPRPERRLFTVGHSNRSVEDLCSVLAELDLRSVADVRRYPRSRRHPQFDRDELAGSLLRHGIAYHWLGRELGGRVEGAYESYMTTAPFARGLRRLEEIAESNATAILCAEREPDECHRRHLADLLLDRGWEVVHLLGAGERRLHRPSEAQRRLF